MAGNRYRAIAMAALKSPEVESWNIPPYTEVGVRHGNELINAVSVALKRLVGHLNSYNGVSKMAKLIAKRYAECRDPEFLGEELEMWQSALDYVK